jgi:hypothetical protein
MNKDCGKVSFKVPSDIAPGNYLIRAEGEFQPFFGAHTSLKHRCLFAQSSLFTWPAKLEVPKYVLYCALILDTHHTFSSSTFLATKSACRALALPRLRPSASPAPTLRLTQASSSTSTRGASTAIPSRARLSTVVEVEVPTHRRPPFSRPPSRPRPPHRPRPPPRVRQSSNTVSAAETTTRVRPHVLRHTSVLVCPCPTTTNASEDPRCCAMRALMNVLKNMQILPCLMLRLDIVGQPAIVSFMNNGCECRRSPTSGKTVTVWRGIARYRENGS